MTSRSSTPRFSAPPSERAEQRALVALSMVPGVGPGRVRSLLARFGSGAAVMNASSSALSQVPGIGPKTAAAIVGFDAESEVDQQLEAARRADAALLTLRDERFPTLLRQIFDPPALLWMCGAIKASDDRALALVGTRRCTDYGRRVARELAVELAGHGFTIVSGLAYGIDAAAHRGALEAGGRTLAVLGSGVDRIYPRKHTKLARQIAAQGAVLSEYPLGAAPDAANFPRRNRIVSGLSLGTIVVESRESGGALITARLAVEQNREVFAVPGTFYNRSSIGCNQLIQRGHAKLILSAADVLDELNLAGLSAPHASSDQLEEPPQADLEEDERELLGALDSEPVHIDVLCEKTGMDASTALVHLLGLEFKGLVRQLAGKQFFRA